MLGSWAYSLGWLPDDVLGWWSCDRTGADEVMPRDCLCAVTALTGPRPLGHDVKGLDSLLLLARVVIRWVWASDGTCLCAMSSTGGYVTCRYSGSCDAMVVAVGRCDYVFAAPFPFYLLRCNIGRSKCNLRPEVEAALESCVIPVRASRLT